MAELPSELKRRESKWVKAQLQRMGSTVAATREALGFDSAPYPKDEKLANAIIIWAAEIVAETSGLQGSGGIYLSIDALQDTKLKNALRRLNPPINVRSDRFDEDETQLLAYESAIERLVHECEHLSVALGTDLQNAARWILAGIKPRAVCFKARLNRRSRAPDLITMKINADVVTAEDVRTIHRQLARRANRPIDQKIRRFFLPLEGNRGRTVKEDQPLWREWNERYPLHQYKNEETFRVVTSRAFSKKNESG